jgi:hypothetical protein
MEGSERDRREDRTGQDKLEWAKVKKGKTR